MAMDLKLALPLHPEYRTLPMVWYVLPLSPIQSAADAGELGSKCIPAGCGQSAHPGSVPGKPADRRRYRTRTAALKRMLAMRHQTCGNRGRQNRYPRWKR